MSLPPKSLNGAAPLRALALAALLLLFPLIFRPAYGQENTPLQRGIEAVENGSYQEGIRLLRPIAEDDSTGQAYLFLGHAHYQLDQNPRAQELYRKAAERKISSTQIKPFLARIALDEGRLRESLTHLRPVLDAEDVDRTAVLRLYGRTLKRMNQIELAIDTYKEALRTAPDDQRPPLLERMFFLYLDQDQGRIASQFADGLVDLRPMNHRYHLLRARAALSVNDVGKAAAALEQARILGGRSPDLFQSLGDVHTKHENYLEAIYFYNRYLEQTGSPSPRNRYRLGLAYLESGQYEAARPHLFAAARDDSAYLNGVDRLVRTLYQKRGLDTALKHLDQFAADTSGEAPARFRQLRGRFHLNEQQFEKAFQAYRSLPEPARLDRQPLYNFALSALRSGHRKRALDLLKTGIANHPDSKNFRSLLDEALSSGSSKHR